jgi:hypothetical protein
MAPTPSLNVLLSFCLSNGVISGFERKGIGCVLDLQHETLSFDDDAHATAFLCGALKFRPDLVQRLATQQVSER